MRNPLVKCEVFQIRADIIRGRKLDEDEVLRVVEQLYESFDGGLDWTCEVCDGECETCDQLQSDLETEEQESEGLRDRVRELERELDELRAEAAQ